VASAVNSPYALISGCWCGSSLLSPSARAASTKNVGPRCSITTSLDGHPPARSSAELTSSSVIVTTSARAISSGETSASRPALRSAVRRSSRCGFGGRRSSSQFRTTASTGFRGLAAADCRRSISSGGSSSVSVVIGLSFCRPSGRHLPACHCALFRRSSWCITISRTHLQAARCRSRNACRNDLVTEQPDNWLI
jgi:hypothetical protein